MRILHISPHLGGGVGVFLTNITAIDLKNEHEFCLLENPIDTHLLANVAWSLFNDIQDTFENYVEKFDIIQIEFWNHPILFKFLSENKLPRCRLVIYAHVSGIHPPNIIPDVMFDIADVVVLSTPAAADQYLAYIKNKKCQVIHGIGGAAKTIGFKKNKHEGINIVYIGTASYLKLHPGFIQACYELSKRIPNIKFVVASNDDNSHLRKEAELNGIDKYFDFLYRVNNIETILSQADLFGYPLRPDHFGTGEQVLLEAMGAGIPPVVLGNLPEKSLIKDGVNGFIAIDIYEYVNIIQYCIAHPDLIELVSKKARDFCAKEFTAENTTILFDDLYQRVMKFAKLERCLKNYIPYNGLNQGWLFFKMCVGSHADISNYENADSDILKKYYIDKIKNSAQLMSSNKGGIKMYCRYFPEDKKIADLSIC